MYEKSVVARVFEILQVPCLNFNVLILNLKNTPESFRWEYWQGKDVDTSCGVTIELVVPEAFVSRGGTS